MPGAGSIAQQFLTIDTIRDNVVVLKGHGLRVVLMCSSLNFALKATEEQDAIIYNYQNFLNGLDFSLQFLIHSRRFNIAPYLEALANRQREETNELLKVQIAEYLEFVRTFVEMTNIMSKTFYVVVPFEQTILAKTGALDRLGASLGFGKKPTEEGLFEDRKNQLWQRAETVLEGLRRVGIRSVPLQTEELIELFYGLYNPTEFEAAGGARVEKEREKT